MVGGGGTSSGGDDGCFFVGGGDLRARENLCRDWDAEVEVVVVLVEEEFEQVDAKARSHTPISARP